MKVGDELKFKKFKWIITEDLKSRWGVRYLKYKVYRKYYGVFLNNTKCTYTIFPNSWEFYKSKLKEDKNYHYTCK